MEKTTLIPTKGKSLGRVSAFELIFMSGYNIDEKGNPEDKVIAELEEAAEKAGGNFLANVKVNVVAYANCFACFASGEAMLVE